MDHHDPVENSDLQAVFAQKLELMRTRFIASLAEKATEIEDCLPHLSEPLSFKQVSGDLARLAHKLKGTALTLRMDRLGALASDLEAAGLAAQAGKTTEIDQLTSRAGSLIGELRRVSSKEF